MQRIEAMYPSAIVASYYCGKNVIPLAYARLFEAFCKMEVETELLVTDFGKIEFHGKVQEGRQYIVVGTILGTSEKLAGLSAYIMRRGGIVVHWSTLAEV